MKTTPRARSSRRLLCAHVVSVLLAAACGGATADVPLGEEAGQGGSGGSAGMGGSGPIDNPSDAMDAAPDEGSIADRPTSLRVPLHHRAAPDTCSPDRPVSDAGLPPPPSDATATQCRSDSDCQDGKNGRCVVIDVPRDGGSYLGCSYDRCLSDDDCGAQACSCRESTFRRGDPVYRERNHDANECFPGNCRVDADCGPGGYCSPSNSPCGSIWGLQGLWCHDPSDECTDDSDCEGFDGGALGGGPAFCAYEPWRKHWTCYRTINTCFDSSQ
jgi:hypothetical protein